VITARSFQPAPGAAGFLVLRERPDIAPRVMPASIIARAEAGGQNAAQGKGYAESPSPICP